MTMDAAMSRATSGTVDSPLIPLPEHIAELLSDVGSPLRLVAHLRAVHDVAHQLVAWLEKHRPTLIFDREAVLFGAATHDIGKAVHLGELSGPGSAHEEAGQALLLGRGVNPEHARFAATHASWTRQDVGLEDLLVSLADKIWKNKRVPDLEDLIGGPPVRGHWPSDVGGVHRPRRDPLSHRRPGRRTTGVSGILPDPQLKAGDTP
ncbi:hypothetical protein [Nonomuraea maheshkhaliensis]|uniref:hypothetical protein n=1 Tax=Nonomuraea maheshkhaliensis TaxID=419590 RepID=UPI0031F9B32B